MLGAVKRHIEAHSLLEESFQACRRLCRTEKKTHKVNITFIVSFQCEWIVFIQCCSLLSGTGSMMYRPVCAWQQENGDTHKSSLHSTSSAGTPRRCFNAFPVSGHFELQISALTSAGTEPDAVLLSCIQQSKHTRLVSDKNHRTSSADKCVTEVWRCGSLIIRSSRGPV